MLRRPLGDHCQTQVDVENSCEMVACMCAVCTEDIHTCSVWRTQLLIIVFSYWYLKFNHDLEHIVCVPYVIINVRWCHVTSHL